jgi:hypothetical protein
MQWLKGEGSDPWQMLTGRRLGDLASGGDWGLLSEMRRAREKGWEGAWGRLGQRWIDGAPVRS